MNSKSGVPNLQSQAAARNPCMIELAELSDAVYENTESRDVQGKGGYSSAPASSAFSPGLLKPLNSSTPQTGMPAQTAISTPALDGRLAGFPNASPRNDKIVWKCMHKWPKRLGFYAALYSRESDGKQVLAFRGTDELLTDGLIDDLAIARGGIPPQVNAAFEVARQASLGGDIYVTGHSLGGALAIIAAARYGLPSVTFNAPGVMDSCVLANSGFQGTLGEILKAVARCVGGARMLNIRIQADPVSSFFTTGLQPGKRVELSAPQCNVFNVLCRHGIGTCIEEVRKRSDAYDELKL